MPLHEHIARGAKSFVDCGLDQAYCGDPAHASAAEGERSYDALAQMIVDCVTAALSTLARRAARSAPAARLERRSKAKRSKVNIVASGTTSVTGDMQ